MNDFDSSGEMACEMEMNEPLKEYKEEFMLMRKNGYSKQMLIDFSEKTGVSIESIKLMLNSTYGLSSNEENKQGVRRSGKYPWSQI